MPKHRDKNHPAIQRIRLFFIEYQTEHQGVPPTVREIKAKCKISSTSEVNRFLFLMLGDGILKRVPLPKETAYNARGYYLAEGVWTYEPKPVEQ